MLRRFPPIISPTTLSAELLVSHGFCCHLCLQVSLTPFTEVDLCAPISTLIVPNATGGYSLVGALLSGLP